METTHDIVVRISPDGIPVYFKEKRSPYFSTRILSQRELAFFGRKNADDKPLGIYVVSSNADEAIRLLYEENQYNVASVKK